MNTRKIMPWLAAALLPMLAVATIVYAQTGGDTSTALSSGYDLSWNTIDNGGAVNVAAGDFGLSGSIGQPDAGVLSGGDFQLSGGFWYSETPLGYRILLPVIVKS
jgi:hypothetical protein